MLCLFKVTSNLLSLSKREAKYTVMYAALSRHRINILQAIIQEKEVLLNNYTFYYTVTEQCYDLPKFMNTEVGEERDKENDDPQAAPVICKQPEESLSTEIESTVTNHH